MKTETQEVSQLVSSLQSRIHCPKVLLVFVKQASWLSAFDSSLKASYKLQIKAFNSHCKNKWDLHTLGNHRCNRYDMDKLKNENRVGSLPGRTYKDTHNHHRQKQRGYTPSHSQKSCRLICIAIIHLRISKYIPNSIHSPWIA